MSKTYPYTLVIGDLHITDKKPQHVIKALTSVIHVSKKKCTKDKYEQTILLGDIFDKTPSVRERVIFAKWLKQLYKITEKVIIISGTDGHDFTKAGTYNIQDIIELTDVELKEEHQINEYIFGHYEIKGTKYITGMLSKSTKKALKTKKYILGHIHEVSCSFDNINYLGSIYRTSFADVTGEKRIATIDAKGKISYHKIKANTLIQYNLAASKGKITKETKLGDDPETNSKVGLKIVVEYDATSLGEVTRRINEIKEMYELETFICDKKVKEIKVDDKVFLEGEKALENYCEEKKVDYTLVKQEL